MFSGNPTTVEASEERSSRRTMLEQSLQEVLFQIIKFVNEKKDHVPPINDGVIYCPFEITMPRYITFLLVHTASFFSVVVFYLRIIV